MFGKAERHSSSEEGKTIGFLTGGDWTGVGRVGSGTFGEFASLEGGRVGSCIFGLLLTVEPTSGWFLSPAPEFHGLVSSGLFCTLVVFEIFGMYGTCVVVDGTLAWFRLIGTVNRGGKGVGGAVMGSRYDLIDQSSTLLLFTMSDLARDGFW